MIPALPPLRWDGARRKFVLTAPYAVDSIIIPAGFATDFASVPRALHWLIDRTGCHTEASVVHDWLYWSQHGTRAEADRVFLDLLLRSGCSRVKSYTMYAGVRAGGWAAWRSNARLRARA